MHRVLVKRRNVSFNSSVNLAAFSKFSSTADALEATTELVDGGLPKGLKRFLKKEFSAKDHTLFVAESKLAKAISKKLKVNVDCDSSKVHEWMRGIRGILPMVLGEETEKNLGVMSFGLAHSLSRFRLKFSSDRVDSMVVQAISLLDDLDKELNTYCMRLKEWYGWHFPELAAVVSDSSAYAKIILKVGFRTSVSGSDLSDILPEDLEKSVKSLAEVSMGTEMTDADLEHIQRLAEQVLSLSEYRIELADYLRSRMVAVAPNLTSLLGELVGARLIAHTGSLMQLAKQPASTVQLLGAEKALFRALKTKQPTPKYGLLFHSSLVGQAAPKLKGKIARVLAAKASLSIRVDAMARDSEGVQNQTYADGSFGLTERNRVEARLRQLEKRVSMAALGGVKNVNKIRYNFVSGEGVRSYQSSNDLPSLVPKENKRPLVTEIPETPSVSHVDKKIKKEKKEGKKDKKEKKDKNKKGKKKDKKEKEIL